MRRIIAALISTVLALGLGALGSHPASASGQCSITIVVTTCDSTAADTLVVRGTSSTGVDFVCDLTLSLKNDHLTVTPPVSTNQGVAEFAASVGCSGPLGVGVSITAHSYGAAAPNSACACGATESSATSICGCGSIHYATFTITAPSMAVITTAGTILSTNWGCPATPVVTGAFVCNASQS
jgi:hypothetical protein